LVTFIIRNCRQDGIPFLARFEYKIAISLVDAAISRYNEKNKDYFAKGSSMKDLKTTPVSSVLCRRLTLHRVFILFRRHGVS
jgi:hypothetical protein